MHNPLVGFQPFVCCVAAKLYTFMKSTNFCDKNINHIPIIIVSESILCVPTVSKRHFGFILTDVQ